ncbi:MAG: hypothetical protein NHG36_18610 [Chromatiaceae bacterium]|jgi:hypothetical protein|nr:hypothetical protein [Candidatus Thioaporhodococcus sediminis]
MTTNPNREALINAWTSLWQMLPILLGMLLLTSLLLAWLPVTKLQVLFGQHPLLDVLLGATLGSLAVGHPLAGYLLGGELLANGVSLMAVTALIVSWVTVGLAQLPAEALLLGRRFAVWRNLFCFFSAIAISFLTLILMGLIA